MPYHEKLVLINSKKYRMPIMQGSKVKKKYTFAPVNKLI